MVLDLEVASAFEAALLPGLTSVEEGEDSLGAGISDRPRLLLMRLEGWGILNMADSGVGPIMLPQECMVLRHTFLR